MGEEIDYQEMAKMAVEIVVAYLGSGDRPIEPETLPDLVRQVRSALVADLGASEPPAESRDDPQGEAAGISSGSRPAVPVEDSVHPDYIVSLEDGRHFRSLRRHLMAKHGLTPDQYRARWGLPPDYPMVAPNYAEERSQVAKRSGLGKSRAPAEKPNAAPRRALRKARTTRH